MYLDVNKEPEMSEDSKSSPPTKEANQKMSKDLKKADTSEIKLKESNSKTVPAEKNFSANDLIKEFEKLQQKEKLPDVFVGDTVRVGVRISEGNKERVQPYEGVVIAKRHGGLNQTITVRRIFQGIGVERVFMVHSPQVASIKVERRGKVRRAKLFYLRERVGKATHVKQRFDR